MPFMVKCDLDTVKSAARSESFFFLFLPSAFRVGSSNLLWIHPCQAIHSQEYVPTFFSHETLGRPCTLCTLHGCNTVGIFDFV